MNLAWNIFADCNSEARSLHVATNLFQRAGIAIPSLEVEPYQKGGFKVSARTQHVADTWAEFVVSSLALAQSVGHNWAISGDITSEFDVWSNAAAVPGVSSIHIMSISAA
jgi:hypothetical protein